MARPSREGRAPDRAATEAALERAALELLARNGVLAGLNLREVAAEAGVNRGLVYHYFGSRRDLLRAALGSDVRERMHDLAQGTHGDLRHRFANFFRTMLGHRRAVVLSTLLVLDGARGVRFDVDATRRRHLIERRRRLRRRRALPPRNPVRAHHRRDRRRRRRQRGAARERVARDRLPGPVTS